MRSRWITLALAALGFVIAVVLLRPASDDGAASVAAIPQASVPAMTAAAKAVPDTKPDAKQRTEAAPDVVSDGSASGAIHFARANPRSHIDMNVRAAVGIWQPNEHRLRVLLLERAPTPQQSASLAASLQNESPEVAGVPTYGIVDLHFSPVAQAFDRNDLETASLIASNAQGEHSAADVLGGIEWTGSLPSPQAEGTSPTTLLELSAAGAGQSMDRESWRQSWQFKVSVPVTLR